MQTGRLRNRQIYSLPCQRHRLACLQNRKFSITSSRIAGFTIVPTRQPDNSPVFQRRDACPLARVPSGRLKFISTNRVVVCNVAFVRSSLRDLGFLGIYPGIEMPGYCHHIAPRHKPCVPSASGLWTESRRSLDITHGGQGTTRLICLQGDFEELEP